MDSLHFALIGIILLLLALLVLQRKIYDRRVQKFIEYQEIMQKKESHSSRAKSSSGVKG